MKTDCPIDIADSRNCILGALFYSRFLPVAAVYNQDLLDRLQIFIVDFEELEYNLNSWRANS